MKLGAAAPSLIYYFKNITKSWDFEINFFLPFILQRVWLLDNSMQPNFLHQIPILNDDWTQGADIL